MSAIVLIAALSVAMEAAPAPTLGTSAVRIYVAPFTGETSDAATLDLIEDRVLVAARESIARAQSHGGRRVELVGARDVQNILDVEATKAAAGCDTTSCANEIADALNADEVVFGQLGRIGATWQLTLTRTHRASLRVLGRSVKEGRGETPEGLLDTIGAQVDEVFDVVPPGPSVSSVVGMGATVLGGVALVIGTGSYAYAWIEYANASAALSTADGNVPNNAVAKQHEDQSRAALTTAFVVGGIGAGVAAVGVGAWIVGGIE